MPPKDWQIWLDTQISPIIAKWMGEYTGLNVKSSYILSMDSMSDLDIYQKAKEAGNVIIISKDADFSELIIRLGAPPKLINLKIGNCSNQMLWELIKPRINDIIALLASTEITIVDLES